jgi:DNA polymerase (family 10)
MNLEQVTAAAARNGVAIEINCQPHRLDLNDAHARLAHERGAKIIITTDAHSAMELGNLRWGVQMARRGWLGAQSVLNTRPLDEFRASLRRHRPAAQPHPPTAAVMPRG